MTTPALIDVSGLTVRYGRGSTTVTAVDDVSMSLRPGTTTALVGESGSGKSTLAQAIVGLLHPEAEVASGTIAFDGVDILALRERQRRRFRGKRIAFVPQDPFLSLNPVMRVGDQIGERLVVGEGIPARSARARAVEILRQVGMDRPETRAHQYPHELSGGMRQRVLIAIALAGDPRFVVADEPTSALDVTVQRLVLDTLQSAVAARDATLLLITHDLGVAAERADRILVMSGGRVVEDGTAEAVLGDPRHPYTRALLAASPSLNPRRLEPSPGAKAAESAPRAGAALEVRELVRDFRVRLPDGRTTVHRAVDGVSLQIPGGTTHAVVGESGSGKSTLARLALQLLRPDAGDVLVDGRSVTGLRSNALRAFRRQAQLVYQDPSASLNPRFSVVQSIEAPLAAFGIGTRRSRRARVSELLDLVALPPDVARRRPDALSGGQRQRVALARAIALEPELLILDEPVSALDVSVQAQILQLLVDMQHRLGLTYLFITHDLAVVRQIADTVSVMQNGRVVESGDVQAVFDRPQHAYTERLIAAIPRG